MPEYRKKKLFGQLKLNVREIVSTLCRYRRVKRTVHAGHVYICVSISSKLSVSNFMGYLKGKSTLMIYDRHPDQQSKWNKAFWARYYVAPVGNVTEDTIKNIFEASQKSLGKKKMRESLF